MWKEELDKCTNVQQIMSTMFHYADSPDIEEIKAYALTVKQRLTNEKVSKPEQSTEINIIKFNTQDAIGDYEGLNFVNMTNSIMDINHLSFTKAVDNTYSVICRTAGAN